MDNGEAREQVIDVACAGGAGTAMLRTHWRDPDFDARQRAFYYVRVLQVPTCRWSTYDAEKLGIERPPHLPRMLQERAITSPVWYAPPI